MTVVMAAALSSGAQAAQPDQKVGTNEAARLVQGALRAKRPPHSLVASHVENPYDREFIYFYVYGAKPKDPGASPHLGNYAVNPWTGEVYDSDNCTVLRSSWLTKHREQIRKRFGFTTSEYEELRRKRPVCSVD